MNKEFYEITKDLIYNPTILQMKKYKQHYDTDCYDHCLEVAYWSYLFCKKLNWDYISVARAAVLHDLFLYDWRHSKKMLNGWHAFKHPQIALENALKICNLNEKEQDIILKEDDKTKEYSVREMEKRTYEDHMNLMPIPQSEINNNR